MHRRKQFALLGAAVLALAACGTRVPKDRIEAAAFLGEAEIIQGSGGTASAGTASPTGGSASGASPTSVIGGTPTGGGQSTASSGSGADAVDASNDPAAGGGSVGPATGSELAIGVLGTFSGPVGVYVKDFATAAQVWGQWVNDNGGLNNHRVRIIVAEDGGSPAGFNSRAQQLVEEQGVVAFAFTTLGLGPGGNNAYLDSAGVLTFGTEGGLGSSYTNPYLPTAVPVGDFKAAAMLLALDVVADTKGITKIATLACSDFGLCDTFDQQWNSPELLGRTGLQSVYRARPSLTTPDFTSICIDARNAGAEAIINGLDTASIIRLADSCARQGYHPLLGVADLLARPELAANPNANGAVIGATQVSWVDTRIPGVVEMQQAFAQYAPGVELNGTLAGGWIAARLLQAASVSLPADGVTPEHFMEGLANLNGTTLGGMTYPLHFTPGQPSPKVLCFGVAVNNNGAFEPGPGDPLRCA